MPLYEVKTKNGTERVRTVAGSPEDKRLAAEGSGAKLIDGAATATSAAHRARGAGDASPPAGR